MRGKVIVRVVCIRNGGITPAYAGKSGLVLVVVAVHEDHPRLCGEKCGIVHKIRLSSGSPPPMRGKAPARAHRRALDRITPAYAGKRKSDRQRLEQ